MKWNLCKLVIRYGGIMCEEYSINARSVTLGEFIYWLSTGKDPNNA